MPKRNYKYEMVPGQPHPKGFLFRNGKLNSTSHDIYLVGALKHVCVVGDSEIPATLKTVPYLPGNGISRVLMSVSKNVRTTLLIHFHEN